MAEGWTSNVLCRYFMHGTCRNGTGCSYSHDANLARPTLPCKFYQCGTCAYGSKCDYLHEDPAAAALRTADTSGQPARTAPAAPAGRSGRAQSGRSGGGGSSNRGQQNRAAEGSGQTNRSQTTGRGQGGRGGQARQSAAAQTPAAAPAPAPAPAVSTTATTATESVRRPMKDLKLCDMTSGARVPVNWADAPEFVPGSGLMTAPEPEVRSYADVAQPAESRRDPNDLQLIPLCPYAAVGKCRYGEHCALLHGEVCEYCQCQVLHPFDPEQQRKHRAECLSTHERDMEHSFRMAKSIDKACGICMEVVVEKKEPNARRFGILPSCSHCFCVACIRQWRSSSQFEPKVTRGCPECRVHSDFICPSRYWVDESEEKNKLIEDYIASCSNKPCKHFNEGRGECPFGNKCFYRHTYPDGRKAELGPPRRRRRQNQFIETELMSDVMLSDFLSDEMRAMDDELAEEAIRLNLMIIQADMMDLMFPSDSEDE
ncbi:putative E3 ubiquitin-protein ligase makorin-2 [Amphibalanus amphitrite]|uniref:RING-type E3 ubiquitin transferase n=1 Tax=Amphibalanus amphitrite TaxID=1232801 RepID=A0A6A4WMX9_AMPAM|nr:probable E3 ubiquitin-protein ligase makorin-1 [Amphibalanus amphitrite]XP_043237938.1 probable E3 ubiquitin-protein ligase makorin-1 [Amphibalanus amphitrite]XP_043237949.1 probable E3 ubiquitin-protein ligase makorin-1 [Amphibalanus amphitrite]KAF0308185.1 putative E3 ubiquitin-protein ligase makorin-2 [Amphibalanus amphitrite]